MGSSVIDTLDDDDNAVIVPIKEILAVEALATTIMNFNSNVIDQYDEMVKALHERGSYDYSPKRWILI